MTNSNSPTGIAPDDTASLMGPGGSACATCTCFEHEIVADGRQVKVWSSRYPENGFLLFDRDEFDRHLTAVKAGELDSAFSGTVLA